MPEQNFDDIIRNKLLHFHTPSPEGEWDHMDSMLNEFEHTFDQQFRDTLITHQVPFQEADWNMMEAKLHGVFDASIKSVLEGYNANFQTADWHAFQEKLDEPFYHVLKQKLNSYSIPYKAGEWRKMLALLKGDTVVRPWYMDWRTSVAAAAIALICVAAWGLTRLERSYRLPGLAVNEIEESLLDQTLNATAQELATISLESEGDNTVVYSANTGSNSSTTVNEGSSLLAANEESSLLGEEADLSEYITTLEPGWEVAETNLDVQGADTESQLPDLMLIDQGDLSLAYPELPSLDGKLAQTVNNRLSFDPEVKIGWVSGTADSRAELNEASRGGFISGLRAELSLNDELSIVSGILYAQKIYFHQRDIFTANRVPGKLDLSGEFQTVELPMLVKFQFPSQNKFNFYLQGGAVTMVTLKEEYIIETYVESAVRNRQPVPSERSYNTYLGNLQAALGVSYEVTPELDLQLEPYFQWGLQKMGSEGKKIYSSGVVVSFMYNLKKKGPPKL